MEDAYKNLTFGEYIRMAREFDHAANLPMEDRLPHLVMGFLGEFGELVESKGESINSSENVLSEAGDLMWYIAMLNDALGVDSFNNILIKNFEVEGGARHSNKGINTLIIYKIAEAAKKTLYHGHDPDELIRLVRVATPDTLSYISIALFYDDELGITLDWCARKNIEKLNKRHGRNPYDNELKELYSNRSNEHGGWFGTNQLTSNLLQNMYQYQYDFTDVRMTVIKSGDDYGLVPFAVHQAWYGTQMVAEKLARMTAGKQDIDAQIENWRDIAGYSMCVLGQIQHTLDFMAEANDSSALFSESVHETYIKTKDRVADCRRKDQKIFSGRGTKIADLIRYHLFRVDDENIKYYWEQVYDIALAEYTALREKQNG